MDFLKRFFICSMCALTLCISSQAEETVAVVDFKKSPPDTISRRILNVDGAVKGIVSQCECVSARLLSLPGEKPSKIEITFNSQGYSGSVTQQIIIIDDEDSIYTITVKANVGTQE